MEPDPGEAEIGGLAGVGAVAIAPSARTWLWPFPLSVQLEGAGSRVEGLMLVPNKGHIEGVGHGKEEGTISPIVL